MHWVKADEMAHISHNINGFWANRVVIQEILKISYVSQSTVNKFLVHTNRLLSLNGFVK